MPEITQAREAWSPTLSGTAHKVCMYVMDKADIPVLESVQIFRFFASRKIFIKLSGLFCLRNWGWARCKDKLSLVSSYHHLVGFEIHGGHITQVRKSSHCCAYIIVTSVNGSQLFAVVVPKIWFDFHFHTSEFTHVVTVGGCVMQNWMVGTDIGCGTCAKKKKKAGMILQVQNP